MTRALAAAAFLFAALASAEASSSISVTSSTWKRLCEFTITINGGLSGNVFGQYASERFGSGHSPFATNGRVNGKYELACVSLNRRRKCLP